MENAEDIGTFVKHAPGVYVGKFNGIYEHGQEVTMQNKYGKQIPVMIWKRLGWLQQENAYLYSIIRLDGVSRETFLQKRLEKAKASAELHKNKSDQYYEKSNKDRDFLVLAEPIKVGHHSESRHRKIIKQAQDNMTKCVEESRIAEKFTAKAKNIESKIAGSDDEINLSDPDCFDVISAQIEAAKKEHAFLKDNPDLRPHMYSLTYAKNKVKEIEKKHKIAEKLWKI